MEGLELVWITDVEYIADFTMLLTFNDGTKRRIDFLPLLKGKLFEPLKDRNKFIQFALTPWTIEWYNGADFAPEYLYHQGVVA
ncbi:DUF2442 domain-containing protein [Rikenella microfusus]|uniref:Protein of uncharacterized function (DUF2442) n=1 Tax=Rikenella microfusus TaxID=28139 RepID=A0A379MTW4_9BACT|nr:Protein of uncharacterised function (DUF2442) [Rikenella microfusus]